MKTELEIKFSLCVESCSNRGDVRLENGTNKFEGRVEVCGRRNDENSTLIWKTVCNAGWDMNEAMVVCRQLEFSGNLTRMFGLSLIILYFVVNLLFQLPLKEMDSSVVGKYIILITL